MLSLLDGLPVISAMKSVNTHFCSVKVSNFYYTYGKLVKGEYSCLNSKGNMQVGAQYYKRQCINNCVMIISMHNIYTDMCTHTRTHTHMHIDGHAHAHTHTSVTDACLFYTIDGQKIAKRLCLQIKKETKTIKSLLAEYDACQSISNSSSNEFITMEDALSPSATTKQILEYVV